MLPKARKSEDISNKLAARLTTIFGNESWNNLYEINPQQKFDFDDQDSVVDCMRDSGKDSMPSVSKIEWTETTWNPITGCDHVSNGCQHCYAERLAKRLHAMGNDRYKNGFQLTIHEDLFDAPLKWKKPRLIFVNSMSDLFHEKVPESAIQHIFRTMNMAPQHTFQILTKRPIQLLKMSHNLHWTENIWMGVTIESKRYLHRLEVLKKCHAHTRFVSFEPLLSDIPESVDLSDIHWVIVGGESGPGARPIDVSWVEAIQTACKRQNVSFFFKQWGGVNKKKAGRQLHGRTWDDMPQHLPLEVKA